MPRPSSQNLGQDGITKLRKIWSYREQMLRIRDEESEEDESAEDASDRESEDDEESEEDEEGGLSTSALVTAMGARAVDMVSQDAHFDRAAAEISKSVPEAYEGEHADTLQAMLSGNTEEAKLAAFRLLVYQVSNNLIDYDDEVGDDNKYVRIVDLFRDIGLPRNSWEEHFTKKQDRSSKAFAEKLFEAAVNAEDLEVAEALLKSGADANQPIMSFMSCSFERPIQIAADNRVRNVELARLLVNHGADVDLATQDNPKPAIHKAAQRDSFEMVQLLIESGASIYRSQLETAYSWETSRTPLIFAADRWLFSFERRPRSTSHVEDENGNTGPEKEGVKILRYLVSLHQKGTFPERDKLLIQSALVIAAAQSDPCLVRVLHEAGGDVAEPNSHGITPLMVAASHYNGDTRVVSYLLDHDAPINEPPPRPSALHFAAARGHRKMVALLIDRGADVHISAEISKPLHKCLLGENFNPSDRRVKGWYTPLQLALHRVEESHISVVNNTKTDEAAITLLEAGAQLVGGELVLAVRFLSRRLVGALLERGASPNERDATGCSALQMALRTYQLRGGLEGETVSDILLAAGAAVGKADIRFAFAAGNVELARFLFDTTDYRGDPGSGGQSLLEAALCSRSPPMIDWALSNPRIPYHSGALCAAVLSHARGDDDIFDRLLEKRRISGGLRHPILEATALGMLAFGKAGNVSQLRRLLKELGLQGNTCLLPFSDEYISYINVMRGFVAHPLKQKYKESGWWRKPDFMRCSPLVSVISSESPERWSVVRMLLRAGYRPDGLCLLMAISRCTESQVEELIRHGVAVNRAVRYDLDTPLQWAVRHGKGSVVRLLLHHGADVNGLPAVLVPMFRSGGDPNEFKPRSALQMAVERGDLEIIDMLLAEGADVNGPMSMDGGATALQCAAAKGFIGIARMLIEKGADVNASRAERYGRTALEAAAEWGRLDMVQFLLENGADTDSEEGLWQYFRALGFAKQNGHVVVAGLLQDWTVLDRWERRCFLYHGLLDEMFVIPDDDVLDECLGGYGDYSSDDHDDDDDDESDEEGTEHDIDDDDVSQGEEYIFDGHESTDCARQGTERYGTGE